MSKVIYSIENKCVMVAGGAGFVGSALVRELLLSKAKVVIYDNFLHGTYDNLSQVADSVAVVQGDVLNPWKLTQTLKEYEVEYIIDCVGDTFVPTAYEIPQRFFDINLQGTFNVLMAAKVCNIKRILYVSSTEVYGESNEIKVSETSTLAPLNTYAVSKLAADRLCFTFFVEHQIPVIIARIFNCYGPRETHPYIIPEIITQLNKGPIISLGNVEAERDFTYVHDTANALIAVITSDIPNGEAVNIGSGGTYKIADLVKTIAQIMDVPDYSINTESRRLRRLDIDRFQCDNSKLMHYTDWKPQVDIYEGLSRTVQWFRENNFEWHWEKVSNDIFYC